MCFSANVSFGTAAVLTVTGIVAISKARTRPQRTLAAIPLIFAVQQFSEGINWLALKDADLANVQPLFTYLFLLSAWVLWPVWIPFTVWRLEKKQGTGEYCTGYSSSSIAVSLCMLALIIIYPVTIVPIRHHLFYRFALTPTIKTIVWLCGIPLLYCCCCVSLCFHYAKTEMARRHLFGFLHLRYDLLSGRDRFHLVLLCCRA